ncbi:glycosyltransferase [Anatilimnocola sp. NA78]|uniref:glycosyltransferase n=1 Tax=Anatilimnocola sp. NA78 TaxID=3415683 RepID=UPI003CE5B725
MAARLTMNDSLATSERPVVLQVLHSLEVGGAEILATRIARRLQHRYEFVFGCLDGLGTLGHELIGEGFRVEVLGRKAGLDVGCVRRLAQLAQSCRAGLIHAHQYTPFFYSRAPGWLGPRVPVLFTEHGRMHPDLPNRKRMLFNRLFLRSQDRVVAVGESVKTALVKNEGIPGNKIEVIYNGVRLDDFTTDASLREQMRSELGIRPQQPVAIQVARLDYLKDHSTAIRAAARVREQHPDFQLLLVGEGPERAKIEHEILERDLGATVRLLGLRSDVRQLLAAGDLFLLTSISEGIPVTLIEAMAARLPIVSTDVGGVAEVVLDGRNGWLAPAKNDEALATGILKVLRNPAQAQQLASAGAERAHDLFSEGQMHRSYATIYDRLASVAVSKQPLALQEA